MSLLNLKAGNLTDEAKEILSSIKDKLSGNKALAMSVMDEIKSL